MCYDGKKMSRKELLDNTLFVMQESEFQFFTNSVQKELLYGLEDTNELREKIESVLKKMDMWEARDRHPFTLSGGQMQRVAIARALSTKPAVILADEPTGNLDSVTGMEVIGLLQASAMQFHQTIVMVTHNDEIAQMTDRIIRMEDGKVTGDSHEK